MSRDYGNEDADFKQNPGTYKRESRYQKSSNTHDHNTTRKIHFPPNIPATIDKWCGKWGFYSTEGFIRDSTYHNLVYYQQQEHIDEVDWVLHATRLYDMAVEMEQAGKTVEGIRHTLMSCQTKTERELAVEQARLVYDTMPYYLETPRATLGQYIKTYE